ncbi:hypothetical protein, partial [Armatimonas sp.]|uniref:hypothetical protein n=1 Tax=Armatimonas sp. TaxID=1872638 RepID=UPI003752C2FC
MTESSMPESSAVLEAAEKLKQQTERFAATEKGISQALERLNSEGIRAAAELNRIEEGYRNAQADWQSFLREQESVSDALREELSGNVTLSLQQAH